MTPTGKLISKSGDSWAVCETEDNTYYLSILLGKWIAFKEPDRDMRSWVDNFGYTYIKYDTTPFEGNV